jgi:Na+-transporting NADH:ubiquinone oxidoreductase subunit NqrD
MTNVPSNLIPTTITQLPEYSGASTAGYLPYVLGGVTYKVQFSNIAAVGAVPSSRTITGGSGLTGGGDLSADRVISIAAGGVGFSQLADSGVVAGTYGDPANIPVLDIDAKGRVTIVSTTPINLGGYVPTSRSILAGAGLTGGGTLAADRTISLTLSTATPQSGGVPSAGTATVAAREDHVHPAVDLSDATETSGVLPMSRGGTGSSLSPVAGAILYSDGSNLDLSNTGTAEQVFFSQGTAAPIFRSLTGGTTGLSFGLAGSAYALSGTLAIASGGTNATTVPAARVNLLPNYTGNANKVLALNAGATDIEWLSLPGTGTVTSVDGSGGTTGLTLTGGPIIATGTLTLGGTLAVANGGTGATVMGTARTNLGAAASGANTDITSIALTTGTISATPTSGTDIVNKLYADSIASGINFHQSVRLATAAALPANTYNNGASGVGATLTANANGALSVDGVAVVAGNRILVKNEVAGANNGVYTVTQVGSGAAPYILTRATDFDSAGTGVDQIDAGDFFLVTAGSTQSNTSWVQQTPLPITVGTTAIVFTQFAAPVLYSAGTGLTLGGTVFSVTNTGVTANTYGSASSVPVIAVNAQGQITSASSTSIAIAASQITSGALPVANGGTGQTTYTDGQLLIGNTTGNTLTKATLSPGTNISITNGAGAITINATDQFVGTVTSVSGTGTVSGLTLTGTVTTSGSLTLGGTLAVTPSNFASQTANTFLAAPNGASGTPTFRAIVAADVPTLNQNTTGTAANVTGIVAVANGGTGLSSTPANGAIDIGNGTGFTRTTLTAGTNVSITNGAGAITINATDQFVGTVTSVSGTGTVSGLSLSGTVTSTGNITLSGTLAVTPSNFASQTANTFLAAPNGASGTPTFRAIVAADVPTLNQNTTGTAANVTGIVAAVNGGTGQSSYAVGDLLFASTTTALSKLADVATGNALISGGVGVAPAYGKIGLTTHVSGTLPVANGGTNATATPTAGAVAYGTGTAYAFTGAGTAGQVLVSTGATAPTFGGIDGGTF